MRPDRGFSLIETIISVFMVGLIMLLVLTVTRSSILVRTSKNQGVALAIARDEIEALRSGGFDALPTSGPFANSLLDTIPGATASVAVSDYNDKTKRVTVAVGWQELGSSIPSAVTLSTLITKVGGLP